MEILFVLLPLSVVLILIALRVFGWAIRSGQFEDLDRESLRILMDSRGDADGDPARAARGDRDGTACSGEHGTTEHGGSRSADAGSAAEPRQ